MYQFCSEVKKSLGAKSRPESFIKNSFTRYVIEPALKVQPAPKNGKKEYNPYYLVTSSTTRPQLLPSPQNLDVY